VGVPPQGNWRAYYRYDPAGNLTEATHPGGAWSGQPNADNQYETAQGAAWLYDGAGNLLDDGRRTYRWDAQSRLTTVQDKATGRRTLLGYDGLSRLQSLTEYATPATAPVETRYLWCGEQICQARNRQDMVTALYYPQGEVQGGTPLYYSRDHLGSVMETTTASGQVQGRLTYGAYGEPEQAEGQLPAMRYAGMLHHPASGFYLTHYRAYDPGTARWLSRDPIGEQGGVNLYAYVSGNPIGLSDALGLVPASTADCIVRILANNIYATGKTNTIRGEESHFDIPVLPGGTNAVEWWIIRYFWQPYSIYGEFNNKVDFVVVCQGDCGKSSNNFGYENNYFWKLMDKGVERWVKFLQIAIPPLGPFPNPKDPTKWM
jgi:RHS repeat-associated protein